MVSRLKELDSALYALIGVHGIKACKTAEELITINKTDDETLTELIKEIRNKIIANLKDMYKTDSIGRLNFLAIKASMKINNLGNIAAELLKCEDPIDFFLFLDILEQRLLMDDDFNKIIAVFAEIIAKDPFIKEFINRNIFQEKVRIKSFDDKQINKVLKIMITNNCPESALLVTQILYSENVNELSYETFRRACEYLAKIGNKSAIEIIEEITLTYIKNLDLIKNIQKDLEQNASTELKSKLGISDIYLNLYTNYSGYDSKGRRMVSKPLTVLRACSKKTLTEFVQNLKGDYANKHYQDKDLVACFISMKKRDLAMQVYENKFYTPIDYQKRKTYFAGGYTPKRFDARLVTIIETCIEKKDFMSLLNILIHPKTSSLDIYLIYKILKKIHINNGEKNCCDEEIRKQIVDVLMEKARNKELILYHFPENRRNLINPDADDVVLTSGNACSFIEYSLSHLNEMFISLESNFWKQLAEGKKGVTM